MKKGTKVFTFRASSKLTAPGQVDGRSGTVTGIIPAGVGPQTRYEVTFDDKRVNRGATYDFYREDLEVTE